MTFVTAFACLLILAFFQGCAACSAGGYGDREVYGCGERSVFLLNVDAARKDPAERLWSWTPADSPEIPEAHRELFKAMDEVKPVLSGSAVLVSSSSGGAVALIRRADKKCLFYASGLNAHSAELIGEDLLAGAFSFKCNEVRLYRLDGKLPGEAAWSMPLSGAHGLVWDAARKVLWALGDRELLKLSVTPGESPSAEVLARWPLPAKGGHDLFPIDATGLSVSVQSGVHRFDVLAETFEPLAELSDVRDVKSVSRHPRTGQILYTKGGPDGWWTREVRFVGDEPLVLPPMRMYKARWNAPNRFSYGR